MYRGVLTEMVLFFVTFAYRQSFVVFENLCYYSQTLALFSKTVLSGSL